VGVRGVPPASPPAQHSSLPHSHRQQQS
jgi:hypothetical protein